MRRILIAALLAATALLARPQGVPAAIDAGPYDRPQRLIDIGGRRLNLVCMGSKAPAVIFDAGASAWSFTWALVQPAIAHVARACAYDRAGMGFSDPNPRAGTSANIVDDLHRLLRAARIAPPYVLVGHSFGGLNTLLYADRFPREVAGMVEVDPSVADLGPRIDAATHGAFSIFFASQGARYQRCAANVGTGYDVRSTALAKCIDPRIPQLGPAVWAAQLRIERAPAFQRAQASEIENIYSLSAQQVRAASRSLGDIPLVILTEGVPARTASAVTRMEYGIWTELHGQFAALSTRGVHETIPNAPHNIQLARPDVVIAAVASVLTMIRSAGEVPR